MTAGASTCDRWYSGPAGDRRAYAVDDVTGFAGGQGRVVRAQRRRFAGDTVGYCGPVSLKLTTEQRPERVDLLRERWARLAAIDHPHVARALEVFEGPGLFRTACPPATDDVLYVAAAWVEGRPLREAVDPVAMPSSTTTAVFPARATRGRSPRKRRARRSSSARSRCSTPASSPSLARASCTTSALMIRTPSSPMAPIPSSGWKGTPSLRTTTPGATHLFEEPGALPAVADLAREWFVGHFAPHLHHAA